MEDDYVEGLTGEEIISDVLEQVAEKLRGDCNLRESDAYTGGYEGTVDLHLKLYGFDLVKVDTKINVKAPAVVQQTGEIEGTEIDEHLDIPLEPRLNLVRERSGQEIPTLGKNEDGQTVVKKRRYVRKKPTQKG